MSNFLGKIRAQTYVFSDRKGDAITKRQAEGKYKELVGDYNVDLHEVQVRMYTTDIEFHLEFDDNYSLGATQERLSGVLDIRVKGTREYPGFAASMGEVVGGTANPIDGNLFMRLDGGGQRTVRVEMLNADHKHVAWVNAIRGYTFLKLRIPLEVLKENGLDRRLEFAVIVGFEGGITDVLDKSGLVEMADSMSRPKVPSGVMADLLEGRVKISWPRDSSASSYVVLRNGSVVGATDEASWIDRDIVSDTRYSYQVRAINASGVSDESSAIDVATSVVVPEPFILDGRIDSFDYLLSTVEPKIYAAFRGGKLYLASVSSACCENDHIVMVSDRLVDGEPSPMVLKKRGRLAAPSTAPFLSAASGDGVVTWVNVGTEEDAWVYGKRTDGRMEGVIDMVKVFGRLPEEIFVFSGLYESQDEGMLVKQSPMHGVFENGSVEKDEFLRVPLVTIRDENANGTFDKSES